MLDRSVCDYDMAIIGGGLAGLTLAILGADAGYRVVLFEKESYPFHKVCGEYISMESHGFLQRCGIPLVDWQLPQINRLTLSDTKGKTYDFALSLGGFGVSRFRLDNELYLLAVQKGVDVRVLTKVNEVSFSGDHFTVHADNSSCTAKVAAGCFGKRSNLDIKWRRDFVHARPGKMNHFIGVKYHIRYDHPPDTIALHNFDDGYCGMSRIENELSCLCYLTTAENLRKSGNSISDMEKNVLGRNRQLKKIFESATFIYHQPLTISQISFQEKSRLHDHMLLLGDAAGMISPLCGNGMSMAMHAAKIAFDSIDPFLSGIAGRQQMESSYITEWKRRFSRRLQAGRWVQYFFGGHMATSVFLQAMHRFPRFSRMIIEQTHGQPY